MEASRSTLRAIADHAALFEIACLCAFLFAQKVAYDRNTDSVCFANVEITVTCLIFRVCFFMMTATSDQIPRASAPHVMPLTRLKSCATLFVQLRALHDWLPHHGAERSQFCEGNSVASRGFLGVIGTGTPSRCVYQRLSWLSRNSSTLCVPWCAFGTRDDTHITAFPHW